MRAAQGRVADLAGGRAERATAAARGPVYIGGLERSGKTTMQAFLTSHPNIAIPDVGSNMWTYFYRRFGDLSRTENYERCLDAMLRYTHIKCLDPDPKRIRKEFLAGPRTYATLFSLFLIHYAGRKGKPRWGAQTGLIERYGEQIFAGCPGAKIVHMVRDPRDRYEASLALWPAGKGGAGGATARWNYSLRLARRNARKHPNDYLIVRFEDLILHTEKTLRRVCRFVGEDFAPEMLMMAGAPERRDRLSSRARDRTAGLLSPEYIGRFSSHLQPAEIAFIQLHTRRGMRSLGYSPVPVHMPGGPLKFAAMAWPSQVVRMLAWRAREFGQQQWPDVFPRRPDPRTIVAEPAGGGR